MLAARLLKPPVPAAPKAAVSYTHLDVYKRQTLLCIRPALACACAPAASTPRQRIPLVSTFTAVSYTHLDVYKRQVQNDAKDQPICVVLMHDTNATHETVKALPDILEWFAAKEMCIRDSRHQGCAE